MIGSFTIQGRLGRGAMGAVYLARSPSGRLVAVKVVRDELAGDAAFRARFAREIAAARRVGGTHTAAVVDADPDAERPWLATEYLPGPTLQKAVETSGPLAADGMRTLARGLAEALMAIHGSGVIHRDLKPSNIVLTENGPRVIDFGIARALEEASLTATGVVIGTPGYLSPEQITGAPVGPASDLFALGSVLVYAASGRGPFATGNPASLMHRVINEQPQLPPLPDLLEDVVRRCLARDPGHRPTPADLLRLLGPPAGTSVPAETIALIPPTRILPDEPPAPQPPPPQQQFAQPLPSPVGEQYPEPAPWVQPVVVPPQRPVQPTGAMFRTTRMRPAVLAVVSTLLLFAIYPSDPRFRYLHPYLTPLLVLASVFVLVYAVRCWYLTFRRQVELHLSPHGLTVVRGARQATVPWSGVTRLRVGGDRKRPWLIAWLEPQYQWALPVPVRPYHGGLKIYPIAHGGTDKRRTRQVDELRAALNWYAGYLHDNSY